MYPTTSTDWLKRLIAFDTTSSLSNLALIDDVANFAKGLGLDPVLTFNNEKTKANLFLTLANVGDPNGGQVGGIVLSGHTDVVPVASQAWSHDPFDAWVADDKLFGRGACDMKGFIACCLAFLPQALSLAKQNRLVRPLHLALSFDEEVGCLGAPLILADIKERGIRPAYCVVGEPTLMQVVTAHKGINVYACRVRGKSVHSSLTPHGVNAISYASQMIGYIDTLAKELQSVREDGFDVPFGTLSVGTIQGGTATNIVPNLCEFTFEHRNLPLASVESVLDKIRQHANVLSQTMQQTDPATGIDIIQNECVPAMTDKDNADFAKLVGGLLGDANSKKVAYATEGGQFSEAGIATIICGPGSIEQAHKFDEFVSLDQLAKCDDFLQKLFVQ